MNEEKKVSTGPEVKAAEKPPTPPVEAPKVEEPKVEDAPLAATTTWGDTPTERAIIAWVSKRVTGAGGTPLSRNVEVYNYLMKQLPELASMIDEENKA